MKGKLLSNSIKIFCAITFSYLFSIILFIGQSAALYRESRDLIQALISKSFTQEVQSDYADLLPKVDRFTKNVSSILVAPLIELAGLQGEVNQALSLYQETKQILPVAPFILGFETPQRYLVAFQNSAEARGTGGIIGAYALITIDRSRVSIVQLGTNAELRSLEEIPIRVSEEFSNLYSSDPAIWQNSNLSPHFPYGARIWLALWEKQFNQNLDGVIALDPFVLSEILKYTGPITVRNRQINSENVISETLSDVYALYEYDNDSRKQYLVEIIRGVYGQIISSDSNFNLTSRLLDSKDLKNRILFYSSDKTIEKVVRGSRFGGVLSPRPSNEYRLVLQNVAGNKMDYYLSRTLNLTSLTCKKNRLTQVEFSIENILSTTQYVPNYVKGRLDLNLPSGKNNSTAITVFLYAPPGARIVSAIDRSNNQAIGYLKQERGRELLVVPIDLAAGEKREFVMKVKGGTGNLSSYEQPLVIPQTTKIVDSCSK